MQEDQPIKLVRPKTHWLTTAAIIAGASALLAVLGYGLLLDPKKITPTTIDKRAKDFQVSFVQGQKFLPLAGSEHFRMQDLLGKPVVLNFWASWCVSCREEAAELERFWQQHKDELLVVGIAIQDERAAAERFANYFGKTYVLGLDEDGKAAIDYGVSGVPETFLIDREGIIRYKEIGPVSTAQLETLLPTVR